MIHLVIERDEDDTEVVELTKGKRIEGTGDELFCFITKDGVCLSCFIGNPCSSDYLPSDSTVDLLEAFPPAHRVNNAEEADKLMNDHVFFDDDDEGLDVDDDDEDMDDDDDEDLDEDEEDEDD